ncbi:type III-B CRISPR-associated protein Cas10/Cmr2 [Chloracidobacterium thermophilum]|uniref:type III-B CRISPR-associated protein Cas10/Cmr2 n=1 Tax=Chloracidobacterium thermophilum TaxID=458033 RepID=UPI0007385916|nr:type III-B CRISPR-associated protein Cas10/Cmr2 [Chloracidobacterium thermophilum]
MAANWEKILLTYLHDPPDKARSIRGHVARARRYAAIVVGEEESRRLEEAAETADPLASAVERFPMPTAGKEGERAVAPKNGQLRIFHPLSAAPKDLDVPPLNDALTLGEQQQLQAIVGGLPESGHLMRLLAIWRRWPEALAANVHPCFALLPADTRTPDHTIWHHADTAAAFRAALDAGGGEALLAFALGPVQRFIEAARTVRDLWSGSMILSWLAFQAMKPILEDLGPTALIYPSLRGVPLVDLWLRNTQGLHGQVPLPPTELRMTPSLPHRFLALVPWGKDGTAAQELAERCRQAANNAVKKLADAVRAVLQQPLDTACQGWDKRWDAQINNYFNVATAVLPLGGSAQDIDQTLARLLAGTASFEEAFPNAAAVRQLARAIPKGEQPGYNQEHAWRWQHQVELAQRSLAAHRAVRHIPSNPPVQNGERFPQKCTLLGTFEQMGPDELGASRQFWNALSASAHGLSIEGVRLRPGEGLCAIGLVKRFAAPAFLKKELGLSTDDLRFPDTWTVAAADWLRQAGIDWQQDWRKPWNGNWLYWSRPDENPEDADPCPAELWKIIASAREKHGQPPVYYAILKLDGDELGGWLRGEKSPLVREVMHPRLVDYYERLGQRAGLDAKRPVGPALHAAISTALANFALHVVPHVVARHCGTVIYSGGDDTLALLPLRTALDCACELQAAYTSDWYENDGRTHLLMGSRATLSGGLVLVHAKDDLRLALQDARRAEEQAKDAGRDALAITVRRRSGEHTTAVCPWGCVPMVTKWKQAFLAGASDRWAYHLYTGRHTLAALPTEAIRTEIRRQLARAEKPTPQLLPPDELVADFETFTTATVASGSRPRFTSVGEALRHFLTLCHTASFMARGGRE